ncbi:uncharacterized protein LOC103707735 [Phoenix dactylifera]|uniref:Uncharacterized protein LOC103707735 n=1 Tax=Phoenix dactylifera TaxID=42345 RepID=A0A8B7MU66_PHODC|nr:uncharacterized protein LOC103707735 [Phoenix dactylifera]
MYLKKKNQQRQRSGGGSGRTLRQPTAPIEAPPCAAEEPLAGELLSSLERRRLYRDVVRALRSGLRDASADFSFLRLRGLRNLLKSLRSIADSDTAILFFRHSQSIPELQVVPVLFMISLRQLEDDPIVVADHIFGMEPLKINSPATDSEVALALRVLEGCCLLHLGCAALAHQHKAVKVLVKILSTRGMLEQGACLDALISLLLDSPDNQKDFEACHGIKKIAELMKDKQVDDILRLKCGEFLLLLTGHVYERREPTPLAAILEDIKKILGEKCASFIWAASQFGSTLDPDKRQTALRAQAHQVLELLELY